MVRMKRSKMILGFAVMIGLLLLQTLWITDAGAFLTDVSTLDKAAIAALTDEQLIDKFIDVMIELEASQTFHETAGFNNPNEYNKYKALLRFRTDLLLEIKKRELQVPQITP